MISLPGFKKSMARRPTQDPRNEASKHDPAALEALVQLS